MQSVVMPQGGYVGSPRSPIGIGGAIAVHALAAGIFLMMPREMIAEFVPPSLLTYAVPADPPKQDPVKAIPEKVEHPLQRPDPKPHIADPIVDFAFTKPEITTGAFDPFTLPQPTTEKQIDPPRTAVFVQALPDPRYARDFQPADPPSMQRMEMEGTVTVRVKIGADGRVFAVEKLFAASEDFWNVTREQALHKWRFRPATRDGAPVESERVMTVHFQIT